MELSRTELQPSLTRAGVVAGARRGSPLFLSGFVYGIAFGSLAAGMGLSVLETVLMSALVFSGSAQVAVMQIWPSQPGLLPAFLIVIVANVRYLLMSASLAPWLGGLPRRQSYAVLSVLVDSAYALGLKAHAEGERDVGVLFGSALMSFTGWVLATGIGAVFGQWITNPKAIGLDFVVLAFCVAAATSMARLIPSLRRVFPALLAAAVIVAADRIAPGPWTVVAAGVTAFVAGTIVYSRDHDPA